MRLPALLVLWLIYPVYSLQAYLREALVRGEPTNYNIANSAGFRELGVVKAAQPSWREIRLLRSTAITSTSCWFIFRHPVRILPYRRCNALASRAWLRFPGTIPAGRAKRGYIIWFTPNQYHHIVAPDELTTIANLKLLYKDKTGEIYLVDSGK